MPHISIKMYPGRLEEQKKAIAEKTLESLSEEMKMDKKYFSVSVEDVEKENWQKEVVDQIQEKDLYVKSNF